MTPSFFQIKSYLSYWLDAVDEHSLHSPFLYDFYTRVVKAKASPIQGAEALRNKLLADKRTITVHDHGTGRKRTTQRVIKEIAKKSLSTWKFSALYLRIVQYYNCANIIELGTSLGINTLYLAASKKSVTTFEGSDSVADIADLTFQFSEAKNINLICGEIDLTLPRYLQSIRKLDFAFIDANHTYHATLRYLHQMLTKLHEKSIIVIDDIHYSPEMEKAWKEIQDHPLVYGSVDVYRCGILFFDPSLNKQHVILQF